MLIDSRYQIWRACTVEGMSAKQEHVVVERIDDASGCAIATDGFIMAFVPAQLESGDVPGPVRANLFKLAWRIDGHDERDPEPGEIQNNANLDQLRLTLGESRVMLDDGSEHARRLPGYDGKPFPWRDVIENMKDVKPRYFTIDPEQLLRLALALGVEDRYCGLSFFPCAGKNAPPIVVRPGADLSYDALPALSNAPFGLIMSMVERKG